MALQRRHACSDVHYISGELPKKMKQLLEDQHSNKLLQDELESLRKQRYEWHCTRLELEQVKRDHLFIAETDAAQVAAFEELSELRGRKCAFEQAQMDEVKARTGVAHLEASLHGANSVIGYSTNMLYLPFQSKYFELP
ncbi:hypothetical protein Efla_003054 [Eimeria flavescens]